MSALDIGHTRERGPLRRRAQSRMLALQALCVYEALGEPFAARLDDFLHDPQILEELQFTTDDARDIVPFARELVTGVWNARARLDERLASATPNWSLARMPPVDRNVLRIGLFELLEGPQTPAAVAINEAVELVRWFGDADSPAFVNGVLDGLRRERAQQAHASAAAADGETPRVENPPADPPSTESSRALEDGRGAV